MWVHACKLKLTVPARPYTKKVYIYIYTYSGYMHCANIRLSEWAGLLDLKYYHYSKSTCTLDYSKAASF